MIFLKKIIIILVIISPNLVFTQNSWKKFFNAPNTYSFAKNICETYDNGYIVGGTFKVSGLKDMGWIVKSDINGNLIYDIKIGDQLKQVKLACIDNTTDGGFIVAGSYLGSINSLQSFVMKFNACGEKEWCTIVEPPDPITNTTFFGGIHELSDGSYIAHRFYYNTSFEQDSESLVKLNHSGSVEWVNAYAHDTTGSWENELGWKLLLASDSSFLVTGSAYCKVQPHYMSERAFWYRVDSDGNLKWITAWVTPLFAGWGEARYSIESNNKSFYYTSGCYGGPIPNAHLYKIGINGDTLFKKRIMDDTLSIGGISHNLLQLNDTNLLISTQYGTEIEENLWSLNITDTLGNITRQLAEAEHFIICECKKTFDNKIIVVGVSTSGYPTNPNRFGLYKFNQNLEYDSIYSVLRVYDSLCPYPVASDTIPMPDDCITVSLPESRPEVLFLHLKIYPNPANDFVSIEIPEYSVSTDQYGFLKEQKYRPVRGPVSISAFSIEGEKMFCEEIEPGSRNFCSDISNWNSGMYFIELSQKGKRIATGKMVKR